MPPPHQSDGIDRVGIEEEFEAGLREYLLDLKERLGTVFHDANNPLAIISGNGQFLLELTRILEVDAELLQPIEDIVEASGRVQESLKELAEIKREISGLTEPGRGESDLIGTRRLELARNDVS